MLCYCLKKTIPSNAESHEDQDRSFFRRGGGSIYPPWLDFAPPWKIFDSESIEVFLNLILKYGTAHV